MITALKYYRLTLKWWLEDHTAPMVLLGALLVTLGLVQLGRAAWPRPPATLIVVATATPALASLPTVELAATPTPISGLYRAVVGFAAPDGTVLGAIGQGTMCQIEARSGAAWALLRCVDTGGFDGAGAVWVRATELLSGDAGAVPDLATPVAPAVVYITRPEASDPPLPPGQLAPEAEEVPPASVAGPFSTGRSCLEMGGCRVAISP